MKQSTTQNEITSTLDLTLHDLERLITFLEVLHNLADDPHLVKGLANEAASICHQAAERLREPGNNSSTFGLLVSRA